MSDQKVEQSESDTLVRRYIRVLRAAWLNRSSAEFQAAAHAFERAHPELAASSSRDESPLLVGEELRWALSKLDYFARATMWQRSTRSEDEAKQLLGSSAIEQEVES